MQASLEDLQKKRVSSDLFLVFKLIFLNCSARSLD